MNSMDNYGNTSQITQNNNLFLDNENSYNQIENLNNYIQTNDTNNYNNNYNNLSTNNEENLLNNNNNNNNNINNNNNNIDKNTQDPKSKGQSLISLEQKSIQMLILYRSLYILKRKFSLCKKEINAVYEEYRQGPNSLTCLPVIYLQDVLYSIMTLSQFMTLPYKTFNELIAADLVTNLNKQKFEETLKKLTKFTKDNIEKYNMIFYEKKMKQKQMILQEKMKQDANLKETETSKTVSQYNKRGKLIKNNDQLKQEGERFKESLKKEVYEISEEDFSILNSNRYLYSETIPLIIADFLQENLNIAIVNTNCSSNGEIVKLNEEIRTIFDAEITKKLNFLIKNDPQEEKNEKMKNLLFEQMKIKNQIKVYQNLIYEKRKNGDKNTIALVEMLEKLREQKYAVEKKIEKLQGPQGLGSNKITIESINKSNFIGNKINNSYSKTNSNILVESRYTNNNIGKSNAQSNINDKSISNLGISNYKNNVNNLYYNNNYNYNYNNNYNNNNNNNNHSNISIISKQQSQPLTKEELRKRALCEIFYFYTKQHSLLGASPTFDEIKSNNEILNLSEFSKFCIEFKILVQRGALVDLFKKYSTNAKQMSIDEFLVTLKKLALAVNDEKKNYLLRRIKLYRLKLDEINKNLKKKQVKQDEVLSKMDNRTIKEDPIKENKTSENYLLGSSNSKEDENEEKKSNMTKKKSEDDGSNNDKENKNGSENEKENNSNNQEDQNKKDMISDLGLETLPKEEDENSNNTNKNPTENTKQPSENSKTNKSIKKTSTSGNNSSNSNIKKKPIKLNKNKKSPSYFVTENKEELEEKISKLSSDYEKLNSKTHFQLEEELYQFMDIDNEEIYRQKMVGFIAPFKDREPNKRYIVKNLNKPLKASEKRSIQEVYNILQQEHQEKERIRKLEEKKKKDADFVQRKKKLILNNKKLTENINNKIKNDNYMQLRKNKEDYMKEKESKVSWNEIQKFDFDHFMLNSKEVENKNVNFIFDENLNEVELEDKELMTHLLENKDKEFVPAIRKNKLFG